MMAAPDLAARTRTIAQIAGPYFIVMGAMLALRRGELPTIFQGFMANAPLALVTGAFTLIVGLCVIAAHHHWTSVSASLISLIGWSAALKGASLMLFPAFGQEMTDAFVAAQLYAALAGAVLVALGAWLTFLGWRPSGLHA